MRIIDKNELNNLLKLDEIDFIYNFYIDRGSEDFFRYATKNIQLNKTKEVMSVIK